MGANDSVSKRVTWWQEDGFPIDRLYKGLSELNTPQMQHSISDFLRVFRALEAFALGWATAHRLRLSHTRTICAFVGHIASQHSDGGAMFAKREFRQILEMTPLIADVKDTNDDPLRSHLDLIKAVEKYRAWRNDDTRLSKAGDALGELLCTIRGNATHTDKSTPYNPSTRQRDRKVLKAAVVVMQDLLERALDKPSFRIAVYGSLCGNGDNHAQICDLGAPVMGRSEGVRTLVNQYPIFEWSIPGAIIPFEVYSSPKLTQDRWEELDAFEGDTYRRLLIPIERLDDATCIVATAYGTFDS